jgi:hypothetical protein
LPRSTYYYQVKTLADPDRHDGLKAKIRAVYAAHRGLYGYRRITPAIRRDGERVNHKKAQTDTFIPVLGAFTANENIARVAVSSIVFLE